ncbi:penicillin-binding transpeptidase domain-containing protein [Neobacillus sp. MER 74]|uniref:penicillin-binding transpeptidase domain-containing protein n=1 Tax=Neobacillus sp. MER 74 TaxID=2939566 RepID=UPI00203B9602|nr:penicillin-binding transpeptidase domain-containing protein [Neobacillus sp. MER 74]MCM3116118.1 penicillin-binding transpeptidase domain-containing protein [Neobacillus sp. MER 74]
MRKLVGAMLVMLLMMAVLAGCSKEPTPQDRLAKYIALWNGQKFDQMYDYLSTNAKKKITKEEFTSRYQKIYKDLQITDLKIDFKKPKEDKQGEKEQAQYSFKASMNSLAGPIQFTHKANLKKEERADKKNWYIDWNTGYIFPKLQEGDKIGINTTAPKRGEILDRNEIGLAVNGQVYEVGVVAGKVTDQMLEPLSSLLKMSPDQIKKAISASWVKPELFVPLKRVSMEDEARIAQLIALEPVQTRKVEARIYPYGKAAAQLIGYVGAITADELEKLKDKGYTSSDMIGKRGLEQVYDEQLRGKPGVTITINKKNGGKEVLAEKPVEDGKAVKLTIDVDVQTAIYDQLGKEAGTGAAMNPVTGETLALVSTPSFDPNQAMLGFSAAEWKALQESKKQPLSTRFKQTFAPGSVMKAITAGIALENGAITPEQAVPIVGKKWQKDKSWGGYFVTRVHAGSAPVNLEKAFVFSDNIYFAQAALKTGKAAFADGLKKFGFEEELAFPFPLEKSTIGALDRDISLADTGYGQGQIQMSIVHLLSAYTPFINNGNMIKPILLTDEQQGQVWKEAVVSAEHAGVIAADLRKVVSDAAGTAHAADMKEYPLAGKTGTAEIKQKQGETGTENGWFIGYNTNSPNLMVAMMVENVQKRGGSQIPVKKVKKVFELVR